MAASREAQAISLRQYARAGDWAGWQEAWLADFGTFSRPSSVETSRSSARRAAGKPAAGEEHLVPSVTVLGRHNEYVQAGLPLSQRQPPRSALERLTDVGDLVRLSIQPGSGGGYAVTVKLASPRLGRVYRTGTVQSLAAVTPLLLHWVEKGYWTRDRF